MFTRVDCKISTSSINIKSLYKYKSLYKSNLINNFSDFYTKVLFNLMSVDGSSITREDLENFYTACESNRTIPDCINKAFVNVSHSFFYITLIRGLCTIFKKCLGSSLSYQILEYSVN